MDEKNKRRKIITITPKGQESATKIKKYQKEWENEVFEFLTDNEFKEFKYILKNSLIKRIEMEK